MGDTTEKIKGKYNQTKGKIDEEVGDAIDNEEMEAEGRKQNLKGHVQETRGEVMDAAESARETREAYEDRD